MTKHCFLCLGFKFMHMQSDFKKILNISKPSVIARDSISKVLGGATRSLGLLPLSRHAVNSYQNRIEHFNILSGVKNQICK